MTLSPIADVAFEQFVVEIRPQLIRALIPHCGIDHAADAAAEAILYAYENWGRVSTMDNPGGYLYRVAQSKARPRRRPRLPSPESIGVPHIEPGLIPAMMSLPRTQRTAVWLVHACDWSYSDVADALDTTQSMVGNHVSRGLEKLRRKMGVDLHV